MVLYERLQMLYEPKIRVTGSFRKLLHILQVLYEANAISS